MATVNKSALVPHAAAQMYALVDDVESYENFLPWCGASRVHSRSTDEVRATIEIAKGGLRKSFTTRNRLQPPELIRIELVDGPFRKLEGAWRFQALDEAACKVLLDLEYEFSNRLLKLAVGPVFGQIANTMVDAFCRRADQVYGPNRG